MLRFIQFKKVFLFNLLSIVLWQLPVAHAAVYRISPNSDIVGEVQEIRSGSQDTLLTIANRYGLGMHEMLESNPQLNQDQEKASQYLGRGKRVVIPAQFILPPFRKGIVINLPELRLYYFTPDGKYVYTYPVGLGRIEWRTPLASTSVIAKQKDPVWTVPKSIHAYVLEETGKELPSQVMPGPENPLGPYALRLGTSGYLIHGTNQPWSIGKYISSGCIRLHNEDITELYQVVPVGTQVHLINYADKAGWAQGQLYLQSRVPLQLEVPPSNLNESSVVAVVNKVASKKHGGGVDWDKVAQIQSQRLGIPQPIGHGPAPALAQEGPIKLDKNSEIEYNNQVFGAQVQLIGVYNEGDASMENGNETIQYVTIHQKEVPQEIDLN